MNPDFNIQGQYTDPMFASVQTTQMSIPLDGRFFLANDPTQYGPRDDYADSLYLPSFLGADVQASLDEFKRAAKKRNGNNIDGNDEGDGDDKDKCNGENLSNPSKLLKACFEPNEYSTPDSAQGVLKIQLNQIPGLQEGDTTTAWSEISGMFNTDPETLKMLCNMFSGQSIADKCVVAGQVNIDLPVQGGYVYFTGTDIWSMIWSRFEMPTVIPYNDFISNLNNVLENKERDPNVVQEAIKLLEQQIRVDQLRAATVTPTAQPTLTPQSTKTPSPFENTISPTTTPHAATPSEVAANSTNQNTSPEGEKFKKGFYTTLAVLLILGSAAFLRFGPK